MPLPACEVLGARGEDEGLQLIRLKEPNGCAVCHKITRVRERVVRYNDGEYWPEFCLDCLDFDD